MRPSSASVSRSGTATSTLLQFLIQETTAISNESKKKLDLKQASDSLLSYLKTFNQNASAESFAAELAAKPESVNTFLIALDSKNHKLVPLAIGCLQRLSLHHAIPLSSIPLVISAMTDNSSAGEAIHVKILQTLLPLLMNYSNVTGQPIADAIAICFKLQDTKSPVVNNTASATFRQIIMHLFDKVLDEDGNSNNSEVNEMKPFARDAFLLFQDLCQIASGEPTSFCKIQNMTKTLALELIETIVSSHIFLLKDRVCPIVMRTISEKNDFSTTLRLLRCVNAIVKNFIEFLTTECEIFLSLYVKLLEADHGPSWHRIIVLESLKMLYSNEGFLRTIYSAFDAKPGSSKIFYEVLLGACKIIVIECQAFIIIPREGTLETLAAVSGSPISEWNTMSINGAGVKVQILDQLDKSEPPPIPEAYIIQLAIQILFSTTQGQIDFTLPKLQKVSSQSSVASAGSISSTFAEMTKSQTNILLAIEMATCSFPILLATLSIILIGNVDSDIYFRALEHYRDFSTILGLLGLTSNRDDFILTLCRLSVPGHVSLSSDLNSCFREISVLSPAASQNMSLRHSNTLILTERNISLLESLIELSVNLNSVLNEKSWFCIFEALQAIETLHSTGRVDKREATAATSERSNPHGPSLSIGTSNSTSTGDMRLTLLSRRLFDQVKEMPVENFKDFTSSLCRIIKEYATLVSIEKKDSNNEKLYLITKLADMAIANIPFLVSSAKAIWDIIVNSLIDISHANICLGTIRAQASLAFGEIMGGSIQYFGSLPTEGRNELEIELLSPLLRFMCIKLTKVSEVAENALEAPKGIWFPEIQKFGLEIIKKILQSSGQNLVSGWNLILGVIQSVVESRRGIPGIIDPVYLESPSSGSIPKQISLVRLAFPSLQLICDDFLGSLEPTVLHECVDTLSCFGAQQEDINISLTAVGLLWSVSDHILMRRQKLEKLKLLDTETESPAIESNVTTKMMDLLWMHLLSHLSQLCSDPRPEVRNGANQTLFRTIGINGKRLTLDAWEECIWQILFPLLERVKISSERSSLSSGLPKDSDNLNTPSVFPVDPRESDTKFWSETKNITLTGVTNSFLSFFQILLDLSSFNKAWCLLLDYIKSWCLEGCPEVTSSALKCFKQLVRYPKESMDSDGLSSVSPVVSARFVELWLIAWDVWVGIGSDILLQANNGNELTEVQEIRDILEFQRLKVLRGSFPHASLVQYVYIFYDIHDVTASTFGLYEFKRLLSILSQLLLYHTNPVVGATSSRLKTENISDLESLVPFQEAFFTFLTESSHKFENIEGAPEFIMSTIASFIRLPFVRLIGMTESELQIAKTQPQNGGMDKGFTYMALAKRSLQSVVIAFGKHGSLPSIYSGGTFEHVIHCLDMPMRAKYDCPSPGTKDSTPLWRCAANTAMTIVVIGLEKMNSFVNGLKNNYRDI